MASVLDLVLVSLFPVCIFKPNLAMTSLIILVPLDASSWELKSAAQLSTYISMWVSSWWVEVDLVFWLVSVPVLGGAWDSGIGVMLFRCQCL